MSSKAEEAAAALSPPHDITPTADAAGVCTTTATTQQQQQQQLAVMRQQVVASHDAGRHLLAAVNDSDEAEIMLRWVLETQVQVPGDKLHLLHVALREARPSAGAVPGGDYFESAHPEAQREATAAMLHARFIAQVLALRPGLPHALHIVQASVDSATVARIICSKAAALGAAHVYVADRPGLLAYSLAQRLLRGSVAERCRRDCPAPLTVVVPQAAAAAAGGGKLVRATTTAKGSKARTTVTQQQQQQQLEACGE